MSSSVSLGVRAQQPLFLRGCASLKVAFSGPFFNEFTIDASSRPGLYEKLAEKDIVFGLPLADHFPEMKQLHDRECFEPTSHKSLTQIEKDRVLQSLIFLVEKKEDKRIKARTCANGSKQRKWLDKVDNEERSESISR